VEVGDLATKTWTRTAALTVGRYDADVVVLPDDRVLVAGGRSGEGANPPGVEILTVGPVTAPLAAVVDPDADPLAAGPRGVAWPLAARCYAGQGRACLEAARLLDGVDPERARTLREEACFRDVEAACPSPP